MSTPIANRRVVDLALDAIVVLVVAGLAATFVLWLVRA